MTTLLDLAIDPAHSSVSRRYLLMQAMSGLEEKKIDCKNCTGTCCTYVANSMQITPLEALEIIEGLALDQSGLKNLKERMLLTIREFRLDHEISTGKKSAQNFRRTYTCPFFTPGPKGCELSRTIKPYGCLAFNPRTEGDNGSQCSSDIELLLQREEKFASFEEEANEKIAQHFKIYWKKMDLPRALVHFIDQLVKNV